MTTAITQERRAQEYEPCPECHRTVRVLNETQLYKHKALLATKTRHGRTCANVVRDIP